MSWSAVPPEVRELAKAALTDKQFQAFALEQQGAGTRRIALACGVSRAAIQDRLKGAHDVLRRNGCVMDSHGGWTIKREAA